MKVQTNERTHYIKHKKSLKIVPGYSMIKEVLTAENEWRVQS